MNHVTSPLIKILDEGFFPNIQSDIILDTLGIPMVKATTLLRQEKTGESKAAGRDSDNEKFVISSSSALLIIAPGQPNLLPDNILGAGTEMNNVPDCLLLGQIHLPHPPPSFWDSILIGAPEIKKLFARELEDSSCVTIVVYITGPIIKILGNRFSYNIKSAVLDTTQIRPHPLYSEPHGGINN